MHTDPEVLALLALGEDDAASDAERMHVAECVACQQEVAELAHLAGVGRSAGGTSALVAPSPEVWSRITAELGFAARPVSDPAPLNGSTVPSSPATAIPPASPSPPPARPAERPRTGRRILTVALAAVLALVAGIGLGVAIQRQGEQGTVVGQAQLEALPAWSGASGRARLERAANGDRIMRVTITSPKPFTGDQQVWLIDSQQNDRMVPLGYLGAGESGFWTLPPSLDVSRFDLVDVSEEPSGDLNQAHSGNSIVRGPLEQ